MSKTLAIILVDEMHVDTELLVIINQDILQNDWYLQWLHVLERRMDPQHILLGKLRQRCVTKPGVNETLNTFGREYRILGGFLDFFAQFYLAKRPITLLLRCDRGQLREWQARYPRIEISEKMKWDTTTWAWIEVPLNALIPEHDLFQMIDASYALVYAQLSDHDRQFIALRDEGLSTADGLQRLIDLHQLRHREAEIERLLTPAILLKTTVVDESTLALGQTKLGGLPDLPADWEWPTEQTLPLSFLAQVNLAEIPASLPGTRLPSVGILYFFTIYAWQTEDGDISNKIPWSQPGRWSRVLFFSGDGTSLRRCPKPSQVEMRTFRSTGVAFVSIPTLPRAIEWSRDPAIMALAWSEEEFERLDDLYFDFSDLVRKPLGYPAEHQLFGYAAVIQNAVTVPGTCLLCQISSDDAMDVMWGDGGAHYFTIREADLMRRDFSNVEAEFQSG